MKDNFKPLKCQKAGKTIIIEQHFDKSAFVNHFRLSPLHACLCHSVAHGVAMRGTCYF